MKGFDSRSLTPQFRMRDLLVLLFVAAVTTSLFVQWIIPAREAARRDACQAKMKAVAVGLNSYADAFRAYPMAAPSCTTDAWHSTGIAKGQVCVGPNWAAQILGQMDEMPLAKMIGKAVYVSEISLVDFSGAQLGDAVPEFMSCPSALKAGKLHESERTALRNLAKGNYAAPVGTATYLHSIELNKFVGERLPAEFDPASTHGIMTIRMIAAWATKYESRATSSSGLWKCAYGKGVKRDQITDGLSHTVLLSEVLPFDTAKATSDDIRGVWVAASMGASTYSHATTPNSTTPDRVNGCDAAATGRMKCIEIPPGTPEEGDTFAAARSSHQGGVNVVFADGSSRFYTDQVDPRIWKALATRAGGETHSPADIRGPGQ